MTDRPKTWTVIDILSTTTDYFSQKRIQNPRLNAERLLSHVLNMDRIHLYLQFEKILTSVEVDQYRSLVKRRGNFEPLQYITGETEFMALPFKVGPDTLIPRPETEILVETCLEHRKKWDKKPLNIWDIGTGSGCIAVSLAYYWPESYVFASDISDKALNMARKNALFNNVGNISFIHHDILRDNPPFKSKVDIIVSNPPYISQAELAGLEPEVRDFEPGIALTDQADGLQFYRRILELIGDTIECKLVFLELSGSQTDKIMDLGHSFKFKEIRVINDLNQIPRVMEISVI